MLSFSSVRTGKGCGADNSPRYSSPTQSPPVSPQSSPSKAHRLPMATRAPVQANDWEADYEACQRLTRTVPRPSQRSRFAHGVVNDSSDEENSTISHIRQPSKAIETNEITAHATVQLMDAGNSLASLVSQLAVAEQSECSSSISKLNSKVSNSSVHPATSSQGNSSFGTPATGFSEGWSLQYSANQQPSFVNHGQLQHHQTVNVQKPEQPAVDTGAANQHATPAIMQEAPESAGSMQGSQPLTFARSHRRAATARKPLISSDSDEGPSHVDGSADASQQHEDGSSTASTANLVDNVTNSRTAPANRTSARCSPSFSPVRRRHLTFADEHEQTYYEFDQPQQDTDTYSLQQVDYHNHVDYHQSDYYKHPAAVPDIEVVNLISDSSEEELQQSFAYHTSQPTAEPWSCFKPAGHDRTHYESPHSSSNDANEQQDFTGYDFLQHQPLQELPEPHADVRHHSVWSASESDGDIELQPTELAFSMHGAGRGSGLAVPRTAGRATLPTTTGIGSHQTPATTNKTSLTAAPTRRRTKTSATQKQFLANRQAIAQQLYDSWNQAVFGGRLPADLPLVWNPRLVSTAGQVLDDGTFNSLKTVKGQKIPCRLELSSKILTTMSRLRTTLAHEMCHVAAWALEQDYIAPHGDGFWLWADRLMSYDARQWDDRQRMQQSSSMTSATPATTSQAWGKRKSGLGPLFTAAAAAATNMEHAISEQDEEDGPLVITRLHTFETHMPYRWQCTNTSCHKVYQRHRCSIDVERHVCSKCKGRLMYLGKFAKDGRLLAGAVGAGSNLLAEAGLQTPAKTPARKPTAYQQFVKEQYSIIKEQQPPGG